MSNRRFGNGHRGNNRSFSQPFQSGVSPWQGGNMNQGGLMSQLSNPQLALALSSLLQQQQPQQPPSLLSLNTSPAFSNNRDFGRFGNRSRDIRRHEPYNKNRGGWRSDKSRKRPPKRDEKKNFGKKKEDKKDSKPKNDDSAVVDSSAEDGVEDEKKETKRDWKDEKNTDGKDESGDEAPKADDKEGQFVGIPPKYLNCFVCNKQMWDGESMTKHVRGRAHHEMIKAFEESIHLCVDILRENMRLGEERKMIELNRQNRLKNFKDRNAFVEPNSHCNMCDLKFLGKIMVHRRSAGHQRLKRYLHPNCRICGKEFPSRLEWIEHRLTPEHLKKLHEEREKARGGKDGDEVTEAADETETAEETEADQDINLEPLLDEPLQMENENPIFELDEVLDGLQNRIPAYKPDRAVSSKSLKPFSGFVCDLCHRSFVEEQDAQDHLKTRRHYYTFVGALKTQFDRRERKRKASEEREKKKREEEAKKEASEQNGENEGAEEVEGNEDQEMYDPEEHTEDAEEGVKVEDENGDGDGDDVVEVKEDAEDAEETEVKEPEPEPEPVPEPKQVKEVKAEPPLTPSKATPRKAAVRNGAGPKSKRLRK